MLMNIIILLTSCQARRVHRRQHGLGPAASGLHGGRRSPSHSHVSALRPVVKCPYLRTSKLQGNFPWASEFHPLNLRFCFSRTLRNPESRPGRPADHRGQPLEDARAAGPQSTCVYIYIYIYIYI